MNKRIRVLGAIVCLLATISIAYGQSDVGSITGFIKDQSGAVIPNANVTITSEATNEAHTVTSDAQGHYTVTNLLPGTYTMSAEAKGFKKV